MPLSTLNYRRCGHLSNAEAAPSRLLSSASSGDLQHRWATRNRAMLRWNIYLELATWLPPDAVLAPFASNTGNDAQSRIRNDSSRDCCGSERCPYGSGLFHGCPMQPDCSYINHSAQTEYLKDFFFVFVFLFVFFFVFFFFFFFFFFPTSLVHLIDVALQYIIPAGSGFFFYPLFSAFRR